MKKSNGGFSLVELIVVIAIMAILAGIAVPTYVKYIDEANNAKYINTLDEIKTAAIATGIKEDKADTTAIDVTAINGVVSAITITTTKGTITVATGDTFMKLMDKADTDALSTIVIGSSDTTYKNGASWSKSEVTDGSGNVTTKAGWTEK